MSIFPCLPDNIRSFLYRHIGAVELPLSCAQILDPDNIGLEHWLAGLPPNDARSEYSDRRLRCYDLVLDSLNVFEQNSVKAAQGGAVDDPETVRTPRLRIGIRKH